MWSWVERASLRSHPPQFLLATHCENSVGYRPISDSNKSLVARLCHDTDGVSTGVRSGLRPRIPTPSLGPHTLAKSQAKTPQGCVDFGKKNWPSAADMDALRQEDDWWRVDEERFSVDNIRKYYARSPPSSAQDADGWRPREHVAFIVQRGR